MYRLQSKVDSASFVQFDVHRTVLYVLYSTAVLASVYRVYSVYSSTQMSGQKRQRGSQGDESCITHKPQRRSQLTLLYLLRVGCQLVIQL